MHRAGRLRRRARRLPGVAARAVPRADPRRRRRALRAAGERARRGHRDGRRRSPAVRRGRSRARRRRRGRRHHRARPRRRRPSGPHEAARVRRAVSSGRDRREPRSPARRAMCPPAYGAWAAAAVGVGRRRRERARRDGRRQLAHRVPTAIATRRPACSATSRTPAPVSAASVAHALATLDANRLGLLGGLWMLATPLADHWHPRRGGDGKPRLARRTCRADAAARGHRDARQAGAAAARRRARGRVGAGRAARRRRRSSPRSIRAWSFSAGVHSDAELVPFLRDRRRLPPRRRRAAGAARLARSRRAEPDGRVQPDAHRRQRRPRRSRSSSRRPRRRCSPRPRSRARSNSSCADYCWTSWPGSGVGVPDVSTRTAIGCWMKRARAKLHRPVAARCRTAAGPAAVSSAPSARGLLAQLGVRGDPDDRQPRCADRRASLEACSNDASGQVEVEIDDDG